MIASTPDVQYRTGTPDDLGILAEMNRRLILDEGHRNSSMSIEELRRRMAGWLAGEYRAVILSSEGVDVGYALYRQDPDWVYLRQFFVGREYRRRGIGRAAMAWLCSHAWAGERRIRVEVLVGNKSGILFWRAVGFRDYSLTLELEAPGGAAES